MRGANSAHNLPNAKLQKVIYINNSLPGREF
jgi:hypothetical protein